MAKILVIDDEHLLRQMFKIILEREGYEVVTVPDGSDGLKIFGKNGDFDLIITDIIMPDKEGLETIIELVNRSPEVKIIAISGGGRISPETYLKAAAKLGAKATLSKPVDRSILIKTVKSVLDS